jgi:hypothetical protein
MSPTVTPNSRTSAMRPRTEARLPERRTSRQENSCAPLGFQAGDENLYRYVHNDPTNHTDPSGLIMTTTEFEADAGAVDETAEFEATATKNGMPANQLAIIKKVAQQTPVDWAIGIHQACFNWVFDFNESLQKELLKIGPIATLTGVKSQKIVIFDVPYGAPANGPANYYRVGRWLSYIGYAWGMAAAGESPSMNPEQYYRFTLGQEHTALQLTFADNSVWYIDVGTLQEIATGSGDINAIRKSGKFFTPASEIPKGWKLTDKVGARGAN